MKILYSQTRVSNLAAMTLRNPRHFDEIEPDAKEVHFNGSWPRIEQAYADAGIPIFRVGAQGPIAPAPQRQPSRPQVQEDDTPFVLPERWEDYPWQAVRGYAKRLTGQTAINREQAIALIRAAVSHPSQPVTTENPDI